jgi:hypothetical protein
MVDLVCDEERRGFYESFGMRPARGMVIRRRERQSGSFCDDGGCEPGVA